MDTQEILALFNKEQRIEIEFPEARKEVLPEVIRFVRPAPGANFVNYSQLNEQNADAVIQEQIAYFRPMGQQFNWKVYDQDEPSDLRERLIRHGFEPDEPDAVMVLDLRETPPSLLKPAMVDLRTITNREQLADVIRVEEQVWGGNFAWMYNRMGSHLEIPGYLSVYVAYVEDQPACTGWTYFYPNSQFAGLWGGSTVPEYRHQGLYTAVLAARVQEAIRRGYRFLTIDAGPMSRPIVALHGFRLLTYTHSFELKDEPGLLGS